ncbi:aminomethyltransferase [Caldanaerobacter subterraneus]|uniref:Aminomethyltransferase n=1 Tax=Caldanaerobacter subterraneus TaxID=911092 RepID=A0A4R2JWW1_9THEO|nr:aminomethyltransferase [Caldanaerobacter subterraneus]
MDNLKKTPLYEIYPKYNAKIIDFAGWAMPVQFESIISEHEAVRNAAGLFDVSHMGEIIVKGKDAFPFLQNLLTNDLSKLNDNQVLYTFMCNHNGGAIDDLLVYKYSNNYYLLVVNAANIEKDYKWMLNNAGIYKVEIENVSDKIAELAIQGPKAEEILQKLTDEDLSQIKFFYFKDKVKIAGVECLVSRTGYTGEDGFEIYMPNEHAVTLWEKILEAGKDYGLKPAGLGARDTLRFEAGLPLYGNELGEDITPLEAGLGFFVKFDKGNFIGKDALLKQKEQGLKRKLVGFEMIDNGIPRHGYEVHADNQKIGYVTTGYFSPTLKKNIGLALIDSKYAQIGNQIEVIIRNKPLKAVIVDKNFYKKNYKK